MCAGSGGRSAPSVTSTSFQRSSATAAQSKPGPRFARGRRRARTPHSRSTASGSFSPWPVSTQTTRPPGLTCATPATPAADAGSQNSPSSRAIAGHHSSSSASLDRHDLGGRLRPARGGRARRSGSPSRPSSRARPTARRGSAAGRAASSKPRTYAQVFPPPPYGSASTSGGPPSSSTISHAADVWPSIRSGLIELTFTSPPRRRAAAPRRCASSNEPSISRSSAPARAPGRACRARPRRPGAGSRAGSPARAA